MAINKIQQAISKARLEDEGACVLHLKKELAKSKYSHAKAAVIAKNYIENFRKNTGNIGLEEFFRQYGLDTKEGVAVMSLAEALLRIPDSETANEFIHEALSSAKWDMGDKSGSSIVKASSLGLKLAKNFLEFGSVTSKITSPIVRESIKQSLKLVGNHFVMGETIQSAIKHAAEYEKLGFTMSYDMLGEGARTEERAEHYVQNYLMAIEEVALSADKSKDLYSRAGISVKLSALYSKYKLQNHDEVFAYLLPRLREITLKAASLGIPVTIDAEEASRLDISLDLFAWLIKDKKLENYEGIGLAVQAYNKAAPFVIDFIIDLGKQNNRRIPVRLVKGAYWDYEIKTAQIAGVEEYPVYTQKEYSDLSYLVCAHKMLENRDVIYPQFATHNALTIASIENMAGIKGGFEFQRLYGMGRGIYEQVIGRIPCRIYAPVGPHKELLPYLIRRILENGASTSFLKKIIDKDVSVEELLADPQAAVRDDKIPLPLSLYGNDRKNSSGFDLGNNYHLELLREKVAEFKNNNWQAAPIINGKIDGSVSNIEVFTPYDRSLKIGQVAHSTGEVIKNAIDVTAKGFESWSQTPVSSRANIALKFADLLEENQFEIIALCTMEAGKTIADSIAELREAVDFCRYYAARAIELFDKPQTLKGPTGELNQLSLHGRGIFMCISPWNFPLAIFTGQVIAALVSGNCVIAKPAEQTPLIAALAVKLLLKAGLPKNAISLLPGDGGLIGEHALKDMRIAGVAFTGSNETANKIAYSLISRGGAIVPFIAETGGINTMIVDSSALIEQAVDDIIISAFASAGQRCSALRVLYVQDDIADDLIEILTGAMANLKIGNPDDFGTDIGPVIDSEAHKKLNDYIGQASAKYKIIEMPKQKLPIRTFAEDVGYFITPTAFEINSIKDLPGEIFGPVLHIARFKAGELPKIIDDINSCGFGLTLGVHSRLHKNIDYIRAHAHVGNMYVNRSMIGATVGVQPFGGEGLSGTGPKAGGPNYLLRFATERTFTENTAAIGGNKDLLV